MSIATTYDDLENRMVIDRPEPVQDDLSLDDLVEREILSFGLEFQAVAEDHGMFLLKELYEISTTDQKVKALKNKLHDYIKEAIK